MKSLSDNDIEALTQIDKFIHNEKFISGIYQNLKLLEDIKRQIIWGNLISLLPKLKQSFLYTAKQERSQGYVDIYMFVGFTAFLPGLTIMLWLYVYWIVGIIGGILVGSLWLYYIKKEVPKNWRNFKFSFEVKNKLKNIL